MTDDGTGIDPSVDEWSAVNEWLTLSWDEIVDIANRAARSIDPYSTFDVPQDVALKLILLLRAEPSREAPKNPRGYVYAMARNRAVDLARMAHKASSRLVSVDDDRIADVVGNFAAPEVNAEERDVSDRLNFLVVPVLRELPPRQAEALRLALLGYGVTEIAEFMGVSHQAASKLLTKARVRVRDHLRSSEESP